MVDRVGPLPVLIMSRIGFAILPFIYAFFPDINVMIALQIVLLGPCFSAFLITWIVLFAYIFIIARNRKEIESELYTLKNSLEENNSD